jgi:PAS domain-containing protein
MGVTAETDPGGLERKVAPDELFFSTTDQRGIIRTGNSVFVRISRYSLEELTGAPHSIIRHPAMPCGAFRLMWDRLLAGRPMGAYVLNLAKDGSYYWVFATITPLGDGFLSVRVAPQSGLFDPARGLYPQILAFEQEIAEREGLDRRAVAERGAVEIEDRLRTLGFESYDDFILEALPLEVAARARLVKSSYVRSRAHGPIGEVIAGTIVLDGMLDTQVAQLESYRLLAARLLDVSSHVLDVARRLDQAVDATRYASQKVVNTAPVLLNVANVMSIPVRATVDALKELSTRLGALRRDVASLRFRIALASLHNDMVAAFAAEVVDGLAPPSSLYEVPLLCDALHEGVVEMAATAANVNRELYAVAELIAETGERLDEFRRFLGQWRILVMRHRSGATLGELLQPIDEEINAEHTSIDLLRTLGQECRAAALPIESTIFEAQVSRIRIASAAA